ncbi:hypothetical protein BDN72DRAFT_907353 [Pluteus cervinus]|uniref:Uncharacterized protein n=1 Tax=Pluteus cervinus TaxID=181527 RepID=A0ACD2ZWZ0_9AGAR|nr:hypothetical protein BDN72DRAFT_907353 [Pluteus cervinus]
MARLFISSGYSPPRLTPQETEPTVLKGIRLSSSSYRYHFDPQIVIFASNTLSRKSYDLLMSSTPKSSHYRLRTHSESPTDFAIINLVLNSYLQLHPLTLLWLTWSQNIPIHEYPLCQLIFAFTLLVHPTWFNNVKLQLILSSSPMTVRSVG